jgi:hypothetical protein
MLEKVEVKKVAKVRRAKLSFLRGRQGKSARMIERFTNADEFQSSVVEKPASAEVVAEPVAAESAPASEQPSA